MPPILNAQGISKSYGATPLFRNIAFTIAEGDRIGLIGPNGSGKSTLLQILSGAIEPDGGEVALRKRTRLSYVQQESQFAAGQTVRAVIEAALQRSAVPPMSGRLASPRRWAAPASRTSTLRRNRFPADGASGSPSPKPWCSSPTFCCWTSRPTTSTWPPSSGWRSLLQSASFASVVVSHDRYFLENVATAMVELNRAYPDGLLRVAGNYSKLLEEKEAFLHAQAKHQDALENRVHREIEWLRRGPRRALPSQRRASTRRIS